MKNGYDNFFKAARSNQDPAKKLDLKKLKKKSISSEKDLKNQIADIQKSLQGKRTQKLKKQFPLSAALFLGLTLAGAVFLGANAEKAEEVLSAIEIKILGTAVASDSNAAKTDQTKVEKKESSAGATSTAETAEKEKPFTLSQEELTLFKNLDERRKTLDQREQELKRLEEELQTQKEELDKRMAEIEQVRKTIANQLEEKVKVDQERVDQLVSFYSSMKPQQAAKVIETLNEDLAVEVLLKMKKKSAAEVMNLMGSDKAQRLSEKFAGYRKK